MIIRWEHDHDYVVAHLHQDMFGDWILSRAWGQIGTRYGGLKHEVAESRAQAETWLDDIDHIQQSRGFRQVLKTSAQSREGQAALDAIANLSDA